MSLDETTTSSEEALLDARARITNLEDALNQSRTVGMALGIIVERQKVTPEGAFELLTKRSLLEQRPVEDVAAEIVEDGLPSSG